jgi:hypothetical protein
MRTDLVMHVKLGVPLAALAHAIVRWICETPPLRSLWVFPLLVVLGAIFGSILLVPAFAGQALLMHRLSSSGAPFLTRAVIAGLLQATIVWLFGLTVGLEPTLRGHFAVTPLMMTAAFLVGAAVACIVAVRVPPLRDRRA